MSTLVASAMSAFDHGLSSGVTVASVLPAGVRLEFPWALALLVIPFVMLLIRPRRKPAAVFPIEPMNARLPRSLRQRLLWLPRLARVAAVTLIILAIARPQLGEGKVLTSSDAVAIQLVVDRSGSMGLPMELDGRELSRLDVVKSVLRSFLLGDGKGMTGRASDLIGLVQFARYADTSCPLVRDHKALQQLVDSVPLARQRYEDGTAIGDGLALAAARLRTAEQDLQSRHSELSKEDFRIKSKVIILLTDGDNNAGEHDPLESAKLAADWGIKVYTIGIGSDAYQIMHTPFGDQRIPIRADVDEKTLNRIAETTGGRYFRARDGQALQDVYSEIDRLEKTSVKTLSFMDYKELFMPLAAAAAVFLAVELMLAGTLLRRTP